MNHEIKQRCSDTIKSFTIFMFMLHRQPSDTARATGLDSERDPLLCAAAPEQRAMLSVYHRLPGWLVF